MIRFLFWIFLLLGGQIMGGVPSRVHALAQVGDGGGLRSVFLISNPNPEASSLQLKLFDSAGGAEQRDRCLWRW